MARFDLHLDRATGLPSGYLTEGSQVEWGDQLENYHWTQWEKNVSWIRVEAMEKGKD